MPTQRAIETKLKRMRGASPEARERIAEAEEGMIWRAKCRKCGAELKGTHAELLGHTCDG